MKKTTCLLTFLGIATCLCACGGGSNESSQSQKSSGSETSSSAAQSSSASQSGSLSSSSENASISSSSAQTSTISSSSESSSIDYTIGWSEAVLETMEPHLGGNVIPFIDLPGRIVAMWVERATSYDYNSGSYVTTEPAHLSIYSLGAFDAALAGAAKMTYQRAGWDVSFDAANLMMHAEENNLGIKVDFYGVYDDNAKMSNPQIDVYYTEPFIVPTSGAWRNSTLEMLASIGVESPHALPYAYLGTLAEEASAVSANSIDIRGLVEGWDTYQSQILAAVRSSYPRSKKWLESTATITVGSGYYADTYSGYSFTKSFSDGYTVTAVLYARSDSDSYYYSTPKTPYLRVSVTHN